MAESLGMTYINIPMIAKKYPTPEATAMFLKTVNDPATGKFFSITPILPSGGGTVRHMYYHPPTGDIWFGTDANTIGRARTNPSSPRI